MRRRFDVQIGENEDDYYAVDFETPREMAAWMIEHRVSTTIVNALWYFPDLTGWIQVENSFVRNAPAQKTQG